MIITLVKANFSANNIGTLDSFAVLTNILNATYDGPTSVEKGEAFTATITMHDGYSLDSINISMGGNILSDVYTEADGVITINISSVSGIILISASGVADDTNGDDSTTTNLTSLFNFTEGGPVLYASGYAYGEDGYDSAGNPNLAYSNYVDISAYDTLTMTIVTRSTNGATGGWAYYTTNDVSGFISDGASANNGNPANGYSADGVATITDTIPDGAKYIRVTYWSSASTYSSTPFSCIGSIGGNSSTSGTDLTSQFTFSPGVLGYEWGWASTSSSTSECPSPSSYPGYNPSLTYSNFVNIEGYSTLKIVNITRKGSLNTTTGGYAFYTSNDISTTTTAKAAVNYTASAPTVQPASFIAAGSTARHHVNYGAEGVIEETIIVPAGAKYIRVTGWAEGSPYQTIPFSCIGYK